LKLLLDTHILLWWLAAPEDLLPDAHAAIASRRNEAFVSAASVWELSIKQGLGKLALPGDPTAAIEAAGFTLLPISATHGWKAGSLPPHHRDPFDRMLVAQAACEGMVLVTRDADIPRYGVPVFPA
jgi:PIN domain nuclease of toxin-antitoxin system